MIHEEKNWLGHPIYRPFDDNTVAFCHEGPHDLVDARMWLVNEDGSNVRKVKDHAQGESCTHEFWVPNGSALVYVSYLKGQQGRTISSYNPDTGVNEAVMLMPACSHLMSNFDGTLLVGDGSGTPVDVKDTGGYTIDNDPYLYGFDVAKKSCFRIARHDTSGLPWQTAVRSPTRIRRLHQTIARYFLALTKMANRRCTLPNCPSSRNCFNCSPRNDCALFLI